MCPVRPWPARVTGRSSVSALPSADARLVRGAGFGGFSHVDDWMPQRLVTATGPNPLPR